MSEKKAVYKTIELKGIRPLHKDVAIIIEGHDITKYVRNVELKFGADYTGPIVTIELVPLAIEIPDEIMAILEIKQNTKCHYCQEAYHHNGRCPDEEADDAVYESQRGQRDD